MAHAIIHPTFHEGMSNVLLEAAASGRPIIASNVPGCIETFEEGVTGFGFESKNLENLVNTIDKFIQLPHESKKKMGIFGREKMTKEFSRDIIVDAYINKIETILEAD
jgi:galacturonosyltransferase